MTEKLMTVTCVVVLVLGFAWLFVQAASQLGRVP